MAQGTGAVQRVVIPYDISHGSERRYFEKKIRVF